MQVNKRLTTNKQEGFTLIELSIVLVIIGLIIGGILTGQDLINAAAMRAQISQIEKYNTAVRTFQGKYGGYLPGDIPTPYATQFGFIARGTLPGEGDGNGILQGYYNGAICSVCVPSGELATFWVDLSASNLIDANISHITFNYPNPTQPPVIEITSNSTPSLDNWLPPAKIGNGNRVYVYSYNNINYFAVSYISGIFTNEITDGFVNAGLTVTQAFGIDTKIDDGLPQSGSVTACFVNEFNDNPGWAASGSNWGAPDQFGVSDGCVPTSNVTFYQTYNCYDNNGLGGTETYSMSKNANVQNCALSFRFN